MLKPQQISLTIYQGASFKRAWELADTASGAPINLTGYTARMQVRGKIKDTEPLVDLTTENDGITIIMDEEKTTMTLYISATVTKGITVSKAVYDLELVDSMGDVYRLMEGSVVISKEVTR
jgi:hypothetical protein